MTKLTPWFPPWEKPHHKGAYIASNQDTCIRLGQEPTGSTLYAYWTGARWGPFSPSPALALERLDNLPANQEKWWRGNTEPQE